MKIRTIELKNYRAFYGTHTISVQGKSMLIYGENGSGKSSLYKALEDFFAAGNQPKSIAANIFDGNSPYVRVIMDTDQTFIYQNDSISPMPSQNFLTDTHRHNPFFTYKRLLRVYLAENEAKRPDLFSILIETILPYHKNSKTNQTFGEDWIEINNALQLKASTKKYKQVTNTTLPNFNNGLEEFLRDLADKTNDWLNRYFNHHVTLTFEKPSLSIQKTGSKKVLAGKEITITPTYFGESVTSRYEDFLNEARLSALALCMYLSSLKIIPEPENYKMLFLDDIFIGLDMSNRIPLLRILKDNFADFQIFLTTYDRAWFELMRDYFEGDKWKSIEMYADTKEINGNRFEVPLIIDPSKTYFEKAEDYFKIKDYPACANYLRKALERQIKKLLPETYKTSQNKDFGTTDITHLETLINNLEKFFEDCKVPLPQEAQEGIRRYKTLVLNPMSHDDLKSPVYKIEIENTFRVIRTFQNLPQISRILLLPIHATITYTNRDKDYAAEVQLADNLYIVIKNTDKYFSQCKYRMKKWTFQSLEYSNMNTTDNKPFPQDQIKNMCEQKRSLEEIYQGICKGLKIPEKPAVYEEFQVGTRGSLQDLLTESATGQHSQTEDE
ncbi:AAA family ATPase [Desulfonema magnum]|uniref:AAA ATPase domain-containing protein n=1 Tax=Desulfonema magnum TaxID=45655 RepID=A0A975GMZ6_9BACT|nr:AAA family ATPase [Desulfonema magnum]QTA87476.1 AAA ATPase domain-containing protein [Desulfonema magnum]